MAKQDNFQLPDSVMEVLPSDPFEQLDIARKVTSIALATRVSKLESDASRLQQSICQKDELIAQLQARVETLNDSVNDLASKLRQAEEEKVTTTA